MKMRVSDLPRAWRVGFDEVAELYDKVRPGFPDDLFDELAAALPRAPVVFEVGPGTGQATKGLVARGASVTAVELGPHLAAVLARNLPTVEVVVGAFEEVELASGAFDAVVAANSYHWVPPEVRMTRPAALLRPGGQLALIALNQVASPADRGFFDEVRHVFSRHGSNQVITCAPARERQAG
jgi:SAM-dependent methyltransferase